MIRSVFTISFYISLSRIVGFVRDILIAQYLGAGALSDTFFAAFRVPNFFRRVFAEGAFNSAFVPIFVEKLADTEEKRLVFVRNIFSILLYTVAVLIILFQLFMPFFMKVLFPGFADDKFSTLVSLSRITIFYLLFICLVSLCCAIMNALGKFSAATASAIILNITLIFSLFAFGRFVPNYAYALSWGVFLAGILQLLWALFFTLKAKVLIYPVIPKFDVDVRKFFRKLLPGIVGANVMQINLMIDGIFASMITGAVSYLYYADRINQLPLAMIGIAIGIALLPALSRKIRDNQMDAAIILQNKALEIGLILVIPASLALTILAHPIIAALFERGKFTPVESLAVAKALMFYSFGLPSYVLVKTMEPGFFARGDTKTPMKIAFACLICNAGLNLIFAKPLGYIGIVLASVFSTYLNLTLLIWILVRKKHFHFEKKFLTKVIKIVIPALLMALTLYLLKSYFYQSEHKIAWLALIIVSGGSVYFTGSYFLGSLKIFRGLFPRKNRAQPSL